MTGWRALPLGRGEYSGNYLAKGADNPSVDLVSTIVRALEKECMGQKSPASSGVNGHQVGDVKSTAAVGRTNISASELAFDTYSTKDVGT